MRRLMASVVILGAAMAWPGAIDAAAQGFKPTLDAKTGERFQLSSVTTRQRLSGERVVSTAKTAATIAVTVIRRIPSGYVFRWTRRAVERPVGKVPVDRLADIVEDLTLEIETDAAGKPVRLANLDQVRLEMVAAAQKVIALVRKTAEANQVPPERIGTVLSRFYAAAGRYRSMPPDRILATYAREAAIMAQANGLAFDGRTRTMTAGKTAYALKQIDRAKNRALVSWQTAVAPRDTASLVLRTAPVLVRTIGMEALIKARREGLAIENLTVSQTGMLEFGLKANRVRKATRRTAVSFKGESVVETLEITRKPAR